MIGCSVALIPPRLPRLCRALAVLQAQQHKKKLDGLRNARRVIQGRLRRPDVRDPRLFSSSIIHVTIS